MFVELIQHKINEIKELIPIKNNSINLFEIMFNPKLEQVYKTYFAAEVDWWIYQEEQFRSANPRFNLSDPKLSAFTNQYNELLKKNAIFTQESLSSIIEDAVLTELNILIRPRTALKWFIFKWEQSKPYNEIIKKLNYIENYKYLAEGFINYVSKNQLIQKQDDLISFYQFDKIISTVDNQHIENITPDDLIIIMNPLFEFFNKKAKISNTEKIPVEPVIIFFDDKNIKMLSSRLESSYKSGEILTVSKKYLLGLIYKTLYEIDNMYGESDDMITNISNEIRASDSIDLSNVLSDTEILKNREFENLDEINETSDEASLLPLMPQISIIPDLGKEYNNENETVKNENIYHKDFEPLYEDATEDIADGVTIEAETEQQVNNNIENEPTPGNQHYSNIANSDDDIGNIKVIEQAAKGKNKILMNILSSLNNL